MAPTAAEVREQVLAQHQTIRTLLAAAEAVAEMAAGGARRVGALLPVYLEELRAALEEHLAFEDRVIPPILEADPPLGPERARRLRAEHRRQRAELAALGLERDRIAADPGAVARRLGALIAAFREDMEEEERRLLTPDVLRDDLVSLAQECG